jgi:hypothetical protein
MSLSTPARGCQRSALPLSYLLSLDRGGIAMISAPEPTPSIPSIEVPYFQVTAIEAGGGQDSALLARTPIGCVQFDSPKDCG